MTGRLVVNGFAMCCNCRVIVEQTDRAGNAIKQQPAGASAFTKTILDGAGRQTVQYFGYTPGDGSSSSSSSSSPPLPPGEGWGEGGSPANVDGDIIVEQSETSYDAASNAIQTTFRQRYHDATGTGPLTYPGGTDPVARVTYVASYPDAMGREQASANYGTIGNVILSRPSSIPARADTVLVTTTIVNPRGEAYQTIDPAGRLDQTTFDDAGRRTELVLNVQAASSSSASSSSSSSSGDTTGFPISDDKNNTTLWSYTADSQIATLTAVNSATGDQTTMYLYGTSLPGSDIARNDVLASVVYPDGGIVTYLVNRQSQVKQFTDQRLVIHAYSFDFLGRQTQDAVISLGSSSSSSGSSSSSSSSGAPSGVDGTVQRVGRTYEVRGLLENITSYSSPIVGQGVVVNDVQRVYNSFEQLVTEYQEHSGAVNISTSVNVQYQYADGSSNTIRPTALVYPNGRVLNYDYSTAGDIDDSLSRIASLIDNDGVTHLADYTRIGANTFVEQSSPEPQIAWSLINGAGIDPYTGLDQFNRVIDSRWYSTADGADLDRIQHGYDRASNRLWRKNVVAEAAGVYIDELYSHDGLYRLSEMQRGQLDASNNGIISSTLSFAQAWGLDTTGNWQQFWQSSTGASWELQQSRTATKSNEINSIVGGGWAQPSYDLAGNMVMMPQPATPTLSFSGVYDAWNRMVELWAGGVAIGVYRFDGLNRRVSKLVSGVVRDLLYTTQWQAIEERLGGSTTPDRQFVWGLRYVDDLVLRDRRAERLFGIQDPNWNITAICDATGAFQERYRYAAYGMSTVLTATFALRGVSSFDWETLFAGYRWDGESAMIYVRRRWLHPLIGRWITSDPMRKRQGNRYLYSDGRPVAFLDPYGEVAQKVVVNAKPIPGCKFEVCCGTIIIRGKIAKCELGDNPSKKTPCHCFVRVTEDKDKTEYHGNGERAFGTDCKYSYVLKCANEPKGFELKDIKCMDQELTPKAGYKDCDALKECLQGRVDACNFGTGTRDQPKPRCYNPECGANNSNTAAYDFVKNCAASVPKVADLPTKAAGCDSEPGAPGWGGWK